MPPLTPTYPVGVPWQAPWYQQPLPSAQPPIQPPPVDPAIHPPAPNVWNTPNYVATLTAGQPQAPAPQPFVSQPTSPTFRYNDLSAPTSGYNVNQAMLTARNASQTADRNALDAHGNVISAERGTLPAEGAVLSARQGVINAQGAQSQSERTYVGQQQQDNAASEAERVAILNARNNTADQAAVAQARNFRANMDQNYAMFGVKPPTDVVNRDGATLPPGTRESLRTLEDIVSEHAGDAQGARKTQLNAARLATVWAGLDVNDQQRMASQAGLTLDEANMQVKRAQLDESSATLNSRYANLDEQVAGTPPFAGAERYTDPATGNGTWLTPAEAAQRRINDEANLKPAKEAPVPASRQHSDTPLGAFSDSELMAGIPRGTFNEQQVVSELVARGLTEDQARQKVALSKSAPAQPPVNPATRYSPTPLGAWSTDQLLNFVGVQGSQISEPQVLQELITRGFSPGQATIMIAQEKLRRQPQTPTVRTPLPGDPDYKP